MMAFATKQDKLDSNVRRAGLACRCAGLFFFLFICSLSVFGQSTNASYPTPLKSNEISGTIKARDLGDSRLTTYYFAFDGEQGDVFVNVVTKNLDGDIDVFTADNLRPLTKITVYSDNPDGETGRVIYLRQPQRLILRIEGKTPTDEPATFRIKFAGSFRPLIAAAEIDDNEPKVTSSVDSDVRVNSVGTIIGVKPKPTPVPKPTVEKIEPQKPDIPKTDDAKKKDEMSADVTEPAPSDDKKPATDAVAEKEEPSDVKVKEEKAPKTVKPTTVKKKPAAVKPEPKVKKTPAPQTPKKSAPAPVDPSQLASIKLVVLFKDGTKIERSLSEVLKFGVDKGILTIIAKDGEIGRYSMLDVEKVTIE